MITPGTTGATAQTKIKDAGKRSPTHLRDREDGQAERDDGRPEKTLSF